MQMPNIDFLLKFYFYSYLFILISFYVPTTVLPHFYFILNYIYVCICVWVCTCVCWGTKEAKGIRFPWQLWAMYNGGWESNLGPLEKQQNLSHQSTTPVCDLYFEMIAS